MSSLEEQSDLKSESITRRQFLQVISLGAGGAAVSGLANAQESRTYREAGREVRISREAERIMREWTIVLHRSEITGPSDFVELGSRANNSPGKNFSGICLNDNAKQVEIGFENFDASPLPGGPVHVLTLLIRGAGGRPEEFVRFVVFPNSSYYPKNHLFTPNPNLFKEGLCAAQIS